MLFDVGDDISFMLVPVPFRPGVDNPLSVDDLFTAFWVHTKLDDYRWENLDTYKRQITIGPPRDHRYFSVHFSDQGDDFPVNYGMQSISREYYSDWKGAVIVYRMDESGLPMDCSIKDLLYMDEVFER